MALRSCRATWFARASWMVLFATATLVAQEPADKQPQAKAVARPVPPAGVAKLNAKQTAFLQNELLPAYQAGHAAPLIRLIGEQVARQSEAQTAAFNRALAEQPAPSLGKMLTDARMNLARLGAGASAPEIKLNELVLMLGEIERQTAELVAAAQKFPLLQDPLPTPANLTEFRDHLWDAHVQNNQLQNAAFLASQGSLLVKSPLLAKVKNPTDAQQAALAIDFPKMLGEIVRLQEELSERTIELRVNRIAFALEVLDKERDLTQRFLAAYAAGVDGEVLLQGLKDQRGEFQREKLQSPTLQAELRADIDRAKGLAGDLIKKSELLFAGLHWWRRGRYGRGTEGNGLLKPAAALADPRVQLALFMPRVSPVPTDPLKGGPSTPEYDRRHHWTWAWEDRQFTMGSGGSSSSQSSNSSTQTKDVSRQHFDGTIEGQFY